MTIKLIRFDWAIKKLLRHKANFVILEGFLSELLKFDVTIEHVLESEGNKETTEDKYNRVDLLVKSSSGELMLVEVQNDPQTDYFHRMLYGVSKLVTKYIKEGEPYGSLRKIYSINIVYFNLAQGNDYVYAYEGNFIGMHNQDVLKPSYGQRQAYGIEDLKDIFPKYYLLKVNNFNDVAKDTLDEWIYFLKNSEIREGFKAKGLKEASEKLTFEKMTAEEKAAYKRFQENRRIERGVLETAEQEGLKKGIEKGIEKGMAKIILFMHQNGKTAEEIAQNTGIELEKVQELIQNTDK